MLGLNQMSLTAVRGNGTPAVVATNLLRYSEEYNTAPWVPSIGLESNVGVSPDGTTTAEKISSLTGITTSDALYQGVVTSAQSFALSVYGKADGANYLYLFWADGGADHGRYFDLSSGAMGNQVGTALTSSSIQSVGNGWYRCSIIFQAISGTTYPAMLPSTTNATGRASQVGQTPNGVLVWGAQLETGSVANGYVKTT